MHAIAYIHAKKREYSKTARITAPPRRRGKHLTANLKDITRNIGTSALANLANCLGLVIKLPSADAHREVYTTRLSCAGSSAGGLPSHQRPDDYRIPAEKNGNRSVPLHNTGKQHRRRRARRHMTYNTPPYSIEALILRQNAIVGRYNDR